MAFEKVQITNLLPYKVASHKIWDVPATERSNILKLDWNEATIPPSPLVQKRMLEILNEPDFYQYYPATNRIDLLAKLAEYTNVAVENLQYFPSSDALHEYIATVFLGVEDSVLILGPTYDNFRLTCEARGAKSSYFNYNESFEFDEIAFERTLKEMNPKLVYICNPNNPTGNHINQDYIKKLVSEFSLVMFLIDEAYFEFNGRSSKDLVVQFENILITRTFSKAFALANFRIGYLISSATNINNISKVRNPKNITTFAQEAVISALSDLEYTFAYVKEVNEAKIEFTDFLNSINRGIIPYPSEGNFILMKFPNTILKEDFLNFMGVNNIFIRNLSHSDLLINCLRITIGTRSQMERVSDTILRFFNQNGE